MYRCQLSLAIFVIFLSGCSKYYLTVKREIVDREALASTFVGSPDPLQCNPPKGEELTFEWRLPPEALDEPLELIVSILYRNYREEIKRYPIHKRRGFETFSLLGEDYRDSKGFLTYKAEIVNARGKVMKQWQQQLWTQLIKIED